MRRCPPRARIIFPACGLLGLLMAGCIPIGYAYPTVSYVPPVDVGPAPDEVHAFRVDVADDDNCVDLQEDDEYVLQPLALGKDGWLNPQLKVAVDYGWVWNCIALIYDGHTHHTMLVRLYRRGFQTIQIESWQKVGKVKWLAASTLADQEQAIDDLVSTWNTTALWTQHTHSKTGQPPRDPAVFQYLADGSAGPKHQEALRFAATEYERLLKGATDPDLRLRLEAKAKKLRQLERFAHG